MNILEANVAYIKEYNPVLANNITSYKFNENIKLELIKAASGDINLVYNNILVHDNTDPQKEAINVFNKLQDNSEHSITVIIGLGLGYLFKRIYMDSKSKIIVLEPSIDILKSTLEIVDFSAELADKRVYFTNSKQELIKYLDEVYLHKDKINISGLASCQVLYPELTANLIEELPKIQAHLHSNYGCLFEKSFSWAMEGMKNLPTLAQSTNIDALKGKFKNKPALIVSSGPSLDDSLPSIAKYKDKAVIFATGNSYKAMANYNIKPDFLGFIEVHDNISQVQDMDISDINLIFQAIASNVNVSMLEGKRKFVFYSDNDLFSRWMADKAGFEIKDYENKGTVSYCLLNTAFILGCNPIILAGQDLAYTDGKCYSAGSSYGALVYIKDESTGKYRVEVSNMKDFIKYYGGCHDPELVDQIISSRLALINDNLTYVQGQNGEMLPSESSYASFIKFFEEFAYDQSHTNLELLNASTGGAQINGYINKSIDDALKNLSSLNETVEKTITDALKSYKEPVKTNLNNIITDIKSMIKTIDEFMPIANDGFTKSGQLISELRKPQPNINRISKLSNTLMNYYVKSKEELFIPYQILTNCVFRDLIELSLIFEDENNINGIEDILKIAQSSQIFYQEFLFKIAEFRKTTENTLTKLEIMVTE
jgi:hypothetical protein